MKWPDIRKLDLVARVRCGIGLVGVALLLFLVLGDKPWEFDLSSARKIKIREYAAVFGWWAGLINLALLFLLGLFAPLWVRGPRRIPPRVSRWACGPGFWILTSLAAIFVFTMAWPRLGQSLWHDEANRVKNVLVGDYRVGDGGEFELKTPRWRDTFFYYRMPNHILQTVASRAIHDPWVSMAGGQDGVPLSEAALRVPSLIAAVVAVFSLALLLATLGYPGCGVVAAWLVALHPWFLRYAAEARGYMIVMATLPILLLALIRAIESGRLRWWALYAVAQVVLIGTYVTTFYVLVLVNLGFLVLVMFSKQSGVDQTRTISAWFVSCLIAGMLFLQLFFPCLPQLMDYLASEKGQGGGNTMGLLWVQNFLGQLLAGIPWSETGRVPSEYHELLPFASQNPGGFALIAVGMVALLGIGTYELWKNGGLLGALRRLAWVVFIVPAILCYAISKERGTFLFSWYLIFLLPGVIASVSLGLTRLAEIPTSVAGRVTTWSFLPILVIAYGVWTEPQRSFLRENSIQPYREAVLATRPSIDPNFACQDEILTATFHAGPLFYDQRIQKVHSVSELEALMRQSDAEQRQLFLNLAYLGATAASQPALQRVADDPSRFREVAIFRGLEPTLSTRVLQYIPNSQLRRDAR